MTGHTTSDAIMTHREQTIPDGEPLYDDTRNLTLTGGGDNPSITVNVAKDACRIIGFPTGTEAAGTTVKVEIYPDKYVVRPLPQEDDE